MKNHNCSHRIIRSKVSSPRTVPIFLLHQTSSVALMTFHIVFYYMVNTRNHQYSKPDMSDSSAENRDGPVQINNPNIVRGIDQSTSLNIPHQSRETERQQTLQNTGQPSKPMTGLHDLASDERTSNLMLATDESLSLNVSRQLHWPDRQLTLEMMVNPSNRW